MAKDSSGVFPGGGKGVDNSLAAEGAFEPGIAPVDASSASVTTVAFDDIGLPMVPIEESVLPARFDGGEDPVEQVPDFLDGLL